jgi:hypothetical protein
MLAYSHEDLTNRQLLQDVETAFEAKLISKDQLQQIEAKYETRLYTPSYFACLALGLLTCFCLCFAGGIMLILAMDHRNSVEITIPLVMAILSYGMLELMAQNGKHFGSGVDTILILSVSLLSTTALWMMMPDSHWPALLIGFFVAVFLAWRFVDSVATMLAFLMGLGFLFYFFMENMGAAKIVLPFVLMAFSALAFWGSNKKKPSHQFVHHQTCLRALEAISLLSFYFAGNYFFVSAANTFLNDGIEPTTLPLGWFFWCWTIAIPFVYIFFGIKYKHQLLLNTGLLLIAVAIFTYRAYYSVMPIETACTLGGLLLLGISYGLIRYLATPKHGFTAQQQLTDKKEGGNLEALLIAETMRQGTTTTTGEELQFGGSGKFDGGGAEGDF